MSHDEVSSVVRLRPGVGPAVRHRADLDGESVSEWVSNACVGRLMGQVVPGDSADFDPALDLPEDGGDPAPEVPGSTGGPAALLVPPAGRPRRRW